MLIGIREQLAMEYQIIESSGEVVLGHFGLWAQGQRVGNFSDVVVLTAVQAQVERSLQRSDQRTDPYLFEADKAVAFETIRDIIYGAAGESDVPRSVRYGCFNLTDLGISAFDGLYVFLVAGLRGQRLLWAEVGSTAANEAKLPAGTYETLAQEYLRSFASERAK